MEHSAKTGDLHEQLIASRRAAARRLTPYQQRQILASVGSALVALALAFLVGNVVYVHQYDGRIYRGVSVAGVDIGGLAPDAARARLDASVAAYLAQPVPVQSGDQRWQVAPADLGVRVDTAAAVAAALGVGRGGNVLGNLGVRLAALLRGRDVAAPATLDDAKLAGALTAWAPAATYYPTDARFAPGADGGLAVRPDQDGLGLDLNGNRALFLARAGHLSAAPVTLAQAPVAAPINSGMLAEIEPLAAAVVAQPLTLRFEDRSWALGPDQLKAALAYRLDGDRLVVALDPKAVQPFLDGVARAIDQPGVSAKLDVDAEGHYVVLPDRPGRELDRAATLAAIDAALTGGRHEATAVRVERAAPLVAADLEPVRAQAEQIAGTPLKVTFAEYNRVFVRGDIQPLLVFTAQPGQAQKMAITLDPAGVRHLSEVIARDLDQQVQDAQFRWADGAVRAVVPSKDGRDVQLAGTDAALTRAILGATGAATPAVAVTPPRVPSSDAAKMAIPHNRLGYGKTYYGQSIPTRKHNVELAMSRLDGTLIAPGATFSFNQAVGAQTVANGYQEAYGIALTGTGQVTTVSSIAGGICQVATTLFQGVFAAGFPIEERNWHLYWIEGYGAPPSGMQGLDATVDDQAGLDFKFVNSTPNWLAIEAVADGEYVRIALYGQDPGWTVQVGAPVITNIKPHDPKPVYEKTHDLAPGQQLMIEHGVDGFDAAIHRTVRDKDGKVVVWNSPTGPVPMDTTFTSHYVPAQDRYQVGVPKDQPADDGNQ